MAQESKILFCIPSLGAGGAERVISVLANQFIEHGYHVSVLMITHKLCVYPLNEKINIVCLSCDDDANLHVANRFLTRLKKIRKAIKELSPDVVISFMSETNIDVCLAMAGMSIPLVVSERNDPVIDPASRAKRLMRKIAYMKPKWFVFQTPDAQAYFSRKIQKRSSIIFNPLTSILPQPYDGERERRIVAVGRLNKQKNFYMLIDAFSDFSRQHPGYTLSIYGEGNLEQSLKEYIALQGMEGSVVLEGFCKDIHHRILKASMYVMSSDFEGMPNALLEAMAIGLPCISTDCPCGGPRMLISPYENGLLVPVNDREKMLEAMSYMVEHPELARKMSVRAVDIRKKAHVDEITKEWLKIVNRCKER